MGLDTKLDLLWVMGFLIGRVFFLFMGRGFEQQNPVDLYLLPSLINGVFSSRIFLTLATVALSFVFIN
jgi:hypothetical protein